MVVKNLLRLSSALNFTQVKPITFFCILWLFFIFLVLLSIWNDLLAVSINSVVTAIDLLLQTIIEACFPDIDDLIRPSRNKVVTLPAELGGVRM